MARRLHASRAESGALRTEQRRERLREVNLRMGQLSFLLRMTRARHVMPTAGFETAMRGVNELGRIVHGWRVAIGERGAATVAEEVSA